MSLLTHLRLNTTVIALSIITTLFSTTVTAEIVFSAPPRESAETGMKLYGPLAEHLSKVIGEKVVYEHPKTWRNYQSKMQKGKYSIIFDGPHFAAWRVSKNMHSPAIKLHGDLNFVLVADVNNKSINKADDLIGKTVCALPSPNLGTLTLYSMFTNPVQQPVMKFVQTGGVKEVAKNFIDKKCDGAILRTGYFKKKLTDEQRKTMRVISEKGVTTNQGLTVSRKLGEQTLRRIVTSLSTDEGRKAMQPILSRFTKKNEYKLASATDYDGHNLLIDNMIFGW